MLSTLIGLANFGHASRHLRASPPELVNFLSEAT